MPGEQGETGEHGRKYSSEATFAALVLLWPRPPPRGDSSATRLTAHSPHSAAAESAGCSPTRAPALAPALPKDLVSNSWMPLADTAREALEAPAPTAEPTAWAPAPVAFAVREATTEPMASTRAAA